MIVNKYKRLLAILFICIFPAILMGFASKSTDQRKRDPRQDNPMIAPLNHKIHQQRILEQESLLNEAKLLVRKAAYKEALEKYIQAQEEKYLNYERDKALPISGAIKIYQLRGEFNEAYHDLAWFSSYKNQFYIDTKPRLEALIAAKNTVSIQPIYGYINYLNNKYKNDLPPNFTSFTPIVVSDIIRLYDYIGDYDAGIRFVDQILQYRGLGNRARADYVKVRQAFEQSKAEGIKSCFETQVPGEACVGHATQVVIQSDYIPW